jgi:hypothetical protein
MTVHFGYSNNAILQLLATRLILQRNVWTHNLYLIGDKMSPHAMFEQ